MKDSSHRPPPRGRYGGKAKDGQGEVFRGQNFRANFAGSCEEDENGNADKPSTTEAMRETPRAVPACPFRVSGYPSKAVTTAEGVPGVLIMTAVTEHAVVRRQVDGAEHDKPHGRRHAEGEGQQQGYSH